MNTILFLFAAAMAIRLVSLFRSKANEKRLKKDGAVEYGKINSAALVILHVVYYFACLGEAIILNRTVSGITYAGVALFVFSMIMLWIVIFSLKELWTVKLLIAPKHSVNHSFIFKYFRHPNYFLNIIPEMLSIAMICQAWNTLAIGLPLYLIPLGIRIYQEEKVMRSHFGNY